MIQNLLSNWRTTSAGLLTIATAIVNLAFTIKHQTDDQGTWMFAITQVLTGIGLMFSRDQAASRVDKEQTRSDIADIKQSIASGDTDHFVKPQ